MLFVLFLFTETSDDNKDSSASTDLSVVSTDII
jgi:hypothetical protein